MGRSRRAAIGRDDEYPMKLIDAIFLSIQMSEDAVICAREPFHQHSEATIVQLNEDASLPPHVTQNGYRYFLAAYCAEQLLEMISPKRCSRATKAEFLCYYASWHAYPAWYYDLEDLSMPNE